MVKTMGNIMNFVIAITTKQQRITHVQWQTLNLNGVSKTSSRNASCQISVCSLHNGIIVC